MNLTDGGEGILGFKVSSTTRNKISQSLKTGKIISCMNCDCRFYRKLSQIKLGNSKFCSKRCYFQHQKGVPKKNDKGLMGVAGREAAAKARKSQTHCKRGHLLFGENLRVNRRGSRVCKECGRQARRSYLARKRREK